MVAGGQGIKYIYLLTFSHADSGGFGSPPLRKHKRCGQYQAYEIIRTNISSIGLDVTSKGDSNQWDKF